MGAHTTVRSGGCRRDTRRCVSSVSVLYVCVSHTEPYQRTLLAWKFRRSARELVVWLRWSAHDAHCTKACPGCLVCVVGALGPFPTCNTVNGSIENGVFWPAGARPNNFRRFLLRIVAGVPIQYGHVYFDTMHREDLPRLGLTWRHSQRAHTPEHTRQALTHTDADGTTTAKRARLTLATGKSPADASRPFA